MPKTRIIKTIDSENLQEWSTPDIETSESDFIAPKNYRSHVSKPDAETNGSTWETPEVNVSESDFVVGRSLFSRVITGEVSFEDVQTWIVPDFDQEEEAEEIQARITHQPENNEEPRPITAEAIEELQRKAYEEAFTQGKEAGYKTGYEQGRQEGYDVGVVQGKQDGIAQGKAEILPDAEKLSQVLSKLADPLNRLDQEVEEEIVHLAMTVARHLVRRELKSDPGQIIAVVRQALRALPITSRNIRVHLHPEDATLVKQLLAIEESQQDNEEKRWSIVEDATLTRGGCQIETEQSRLDATVEARLAAIIVQALGGERERDSAH